MDSTNVSSRDRDQTERTPEKRTIAGFPLFAFVIAELACTAIIVVAVLVM